MGADLEAPLLGLPEDILAMIAEMAASVGEAAERNTIRWGRQMRLDPGEWSREVDELELWVRARLEWYDRAVESLR